MTLEVGPSGYRLEAGQGEPLWFARRTAHLQDHRRADRRALGHGRVPGSTRHRVTDPPSPGRGRGVVRPRGPAHLLAGRQPITAEAGDFVFGPRGVTHRFRVDSEEARFLLVLTPAGFEDFTRASGWPATADTLSPPNLPAPDAERLAAAIAQTGLEIFES
jgi:hypothetical protein